MEDLSPIVKQFSGKKIAVVGDLMVDCYVYGKARFNPEHPVAPVLTVAHKEYRLGGAANVAANLAAQGAQVFLYGFLGDDFEAKRFEDLCLKQGIILERVMEGKTIVKTRFIEEGQGYYVARIDEDCRFDPSESLLDSIFNKVRELGPDAVVLSDYNKTVLRGALVQKIINWSGDVPVISDLKPVNSVLFKGSTVVCPNLDEARAIVNLPSESTVEEVAMKLKNQLESKYAVITCGKDGMVTYDGGFHKVPTQAREVVDVVGAGDTTTALLALSLASGAEITQAAQIANFGAGIVVEKQGTSTVSRGELLGRIERV